MKNEKEDYRVRVTKQVIRSTLLKLMKNKSVTDISVTEICKEAGVNRGTFYNHFSNPMEVLDKIKYNFVNDVFSIFLKPTTSQEEYRNRFIHMVTKISESKEETMVILDCLTIHDIEKAAVKFAETTGTSVKKINLPFIFYYAGTSAVLREWIRSRSSLTPTEIGTDLYELAIGRKL